MRRTRAADAALLVSLLVLWVACTALHVKQLATGQLGWVGVYVATSPDGTGDPVVRGFWPGGTADATGGLAVGDRLLRAGDADLRGVGPFGFVALAQQAAAARGDLRFAIRYARGGVSGETTLALVPVAFPWRMLPLTVTLVLTGALVLARRPGTRVARAFFLLAVAYGLHWTFFFGGPRLQTDAWLVVFLAASTVMLPLLLRGVLLFPAEVAPADGRLPWWPWLFAVFGPVSASWIYGVPLPPDVGFRAVFAVNVAFIATVLALLTRNYSRAGALGRRQLRWVVLGMYVGTVPVLLTDVAAAIDPALWWLHEVAVIAEIVIPICVLIAIVRTNYLDVDRLITGAAVYSVLSVALLVAVLVAVPQMAHAASRAIGLDLDTTQLVLSLLVAASVIPAQRLLRPHVERALFQERHALGVGVEALLRDLAACEGPDDVLSLAGERLDELLRPYSCTIYAPLGPRFVPVLSRGVDTAGMRIDTPPLKVDGAVIRALQERTAPLDVMRWRPAPGEEASTRERDALEGLRTAVLLPVRRGGDLAAFISLGVKRSGDVYTSTDLALLAAVSEKIAGELLRFDAAHVLRQEKKMSEALRRYVPRTVAARLTRGQSIEGCERDVSVLFLDIRGYTKMSEEQSAGDVFSMLNRYTQAVSAVIEEHGGTVVEFLGDGVMAVFGAPEPVRDHARTAVEAACEVVVAVRRMALRLDAADVPIAVGVGVASGAAFVGNIRTGERFVYTAVGDVVNLASRIQGLTRELDATVAIDAQTFQQAGDAAAGFRRHERLRIRGRSKPVHVYSLPVLGENRDVSRVL